MPADELRLQEGFPEEKLIVLPRYSVEELAEYGLTRSLFVSDIGFFPRALYHYRERPEGCDSHIVIYCVKGEGWVMLDGREHQVTERTFIILPAGEPHRYGASKQDPWSIYWLHLKGDQAAAMIRLYGLDTGPVTISPAKQTEWIDSFNRCYALLADKPYSMPVQVHISQTIGQLLGLIGLGEGGTATERKRGQNLERAIRYLNDRLADSVALPELAAHTGLSRQHLTYLFNQETGFPPIEYFLRMKMQKAGQLLSLTDLHVKEIAASVGIPDPYYFSRLFKKRMGLSPTAYRSAPRG